MYLRQHILSFLFLCLVSSAFSQRGKDGNGLISTTQTVNVYTTLTADVLANTTNTITVANTNGFSAGDLVLIIQMQGAWARYAAGDTVPPWYDATAAVPTDTSYGRIMAYNGAGNNELAEISSVNSGSNTIVLDCQISKSFKASGKTQVIRIPRYSSLTISGTITCPHWDRTLGYGGVIAIEVSGNTTINTGGKIDASGLGFRGGAFWFKNTNAPGSTLYGTNRRNEAGNKGESIAGDTNVYANEASKFGRGAIANGGGGGDATNSGGGGGANAGFTNKYFGGIGNIDTTTNTNYITAWNLENNAYPGVLPLWRANTNAGGGRGGYSYSNSTSNPLTTAPNNTAWNTSADSRRSVGGLGGRPLDYSNKQLFLGGGGGSGDGDNYYQGAGGDGGGIIYFISYGSISGSGQIVANGANGSNSYTTGPRGGDNQFSLLGRDGAGGGGGGGAITIKSIGSVTGISVSAIGGNGGNASLAATTSTNNSYGPGGGGGGGYINLPTATLITSNVNGGNNGIVTISGSNGSLIDNNFPPNGATRGGPGTLTFSSDIYTIISVNDTICSGNSTILSASIIGTAQAGTNINWFTASTGGIAIATGTSFTTPVLNATTDYWIGTCPGTHRVKVTVVVTSSVNAPVASGVTYCQNAIASSLTPNSGSYNWYTVSSGGTSQSSITPSTTTIGTATYYVSQGSGSCESPRTAVQVNVVAPPAGPQVSGPIVYCRNATAQAIPVTPSISGNTINYWGTNANGGTSSTTPTIPSTSVVGTTTYYFSESNGTCESNRTSVNVVVNAIPNPPTVTDTIAYCQNQTATALTPSGASILWYTSAIGGVGTTTAPVPSTTTSGVTTYYVSQTQNNCESNRDSVKIVVNTGFSAPTASGVTYCQNAPAQSLSPNGTGYNWYTVSLGGTAQSSITPTTTTIGTTTYYVSQGNGSCESPRTAVQVNVVAPPAGPQVSGPIAYCQNATAQAIPTTPSVSGNTINYWGTNANGGTSSTTPTIPSTGSVGTITYYFSESNGTCESNRTSVDVVVNAIPNPPSTTDTIAYCQNQTATALTPSGASIVWYTSAIGGVGTTTAPVPSTATSGVTTYYVSQTQNNCESNRDSVKVLVNTGFSAPTASGVTYCQNAPAQSLSPNGTGYNWYTVSSGGTAQLSITPTTTTVGITTYYVSQGNGSCESPRTAVQVNVVAPPAGPQFSGPIAYCQNATAQAITATPSVSGNTVSYWGTNASGGTLSTVPIIPSTGSVGTTTYYFSESNGTCESNRTSVDVVVNAIPNPPAVTDTIAYCQNQPVTALTPSGASILWYTSAIGGVGTTTAPVPSTITTGVTTYYVSQTQNNCESSRDSIKVVVSTGFSAPSASGVTYCQNAPAQSLSPNGTGYNWYDVSIGGAAQSNITPSTTTVGITTYYVSQGNGSCESPRTAVDVVVNSIPEQPIATDVIYCINETPGSLVVISTGGLTWYNQGSGGVGFTTDPTVNTSSVGSFNYFVSQTINGCESNRDTLTVTVIDLQNPPTTQSVNYCKDDVAISLTANGTSNLNWWGTNASGGTSTGIAPVPNTSIAGTTTYYVSQGTGACESPRTPLTVTVNDLPAVSFTQSANSICGGKCIVFNAQTSTSCTNLSWNFGNGSTSTNTSETICFNNAGSFDVSLSCTDANGCSNNSIIQNAVIVDQTPVADFSISPANIVSPGSSVIFTADTSSANGASYEWYFDDASSGNLNTSTETNPNHVYNNTGNYCIVLVASLNNCRDTISKCIDVLSDPKIIIPNLFTPNGDGINELFTVTAEGVTQFEIEFFDRWGESVFNSKSIDISWDGKNKSGKKVSNGVYYYIVTYTDFKSQSKTLTGFVSLIGN